MQQDRWDGRVIALHWLTVASVLTAFAAVWARDAFDDRAIRATLLGAHRSAGLLAFGLTVVRMAVRTRVTGPEIPLHWLQALAAKLTHLALYALLIAQPLLGWAYSSARGQTILLFGTLPVPPLLGLGRDMAESLGEAHATAGTLFLVLIGLHAGAALYHGVLRRDGVAEAMLPQVRPRRA